MNEKIRAKIEELLGWAPRSSTRFSLRTLQSLVRGKDAKFDKELALYLDSGSHFFASTEISEEG